MGATIRQATAGDALLVAALTIQAARSRGAIPEPGFMDRFAGVWREYRDLHPVWWAECDNQHVGMLRAARIRPLPWPHRSGGGTMLLELLFVREEYAGSGVAEDLREAARAWAEVRGIGNIHLDAELDS